MLGFVEWKLQCGENKQDLNRVNSKGHCPRTMKDFRPISLCSIMYKIVSKCLVNRLKVFLDDLISKNHSALLGGRLIHDNFITGFENIHIIKQERFGNGRKMTLKLDISKAFDCVE